MEASQEKRIRDFIETVNRCLDTFKLSLRQYDTERRCLERMISGEQKCSPENLYTVGRGLLSLVTEETTKGGRQDTIHAFWHRLLSELHQRFPVANTPDQWVELEGVVDRSQLDKNKWKAFLNRWVHPPISLGLRPEITAALKPYREDMEEKFNEISLSGFGGPAIQSEAEGKAELSKVYIDLDTKAEPELEPEGRTRLVGTAQSQSDFCVVPALQRLAVNPRLVLIGLPGSGKSTLLKFFSLSLARCGLQPKAEWLKNLKFWPQEETDLIPVFVELRQFAASISRALPAEPSGLHLTNYILSQLKISQLEQCAEALKESLAAGRAIVLLDGLDEVPDDDKLRRFVLDTVEAFARGPFKASRIVVTCRPRSYEDSEWRLEGFKIAELAALDAPKINRFIELFYAEVAQHDPRLAAVKMDRITKLELAVQREELQDLATNPLMLTVMAWLHRSVELPRKRALILNLLVDQLLFKWEESRVRDDTEKVQTLSELLGQHDLEVTSLRRVLCRLAFRSRQKVQPRLVGQHSNFAVSILKTDLLSQLAELPPKDKISETNRAQWALRVIQVIDRRTGLLVPEGGDSFIMPYKLQEYLAGEHLTDGDELEALAEEFPVPKHEFGCVLAHLIGENGYWEEVVKWAAAIQAHVKNNKGEVRDLAFELCENQIQSDAKVLRCAVVAEEILSEVGLNEVANTRHGLDCLALVRKTLDDCMFKKKLTAKQRATAGVCRGHLENLPSGIGVNNEGIPNIAWIKIPSGEFLMGDEESWPGKKKPLKTPVKTSYGISRYPVTVAQFRAFLEDGGYEEELYWDWSKEATFFFREIQRKWKSDKQKPGPVEYEPVFQTPSHPRVGVSWFEAVAFCRWLNQKPEYVGNIIRLPTEMEWERAVRGTEGRSWPWGEGNSDLSRNGNFYHSNIGHTSAVGLFPSGDTPMENGNKLGLADLAGNVWEWCLTQWWDKSPVNYDGLTSEKLDGDSTRVARGGSYNYGPLGIMRYFSPMRRGFFPDLQKPDLGFRLVCLDKSDK